MPTNPVPKVLTGAGFLLWAPLGSNIPAHSAVGGVYVDEWPVSWIELGATDEGKTFTYETTIEPIEVAEFLDPIKYETVTREGTFAFALADYTLSNYQIVFNGGDLVTSGTGATAINTYEPPDPGEEVRAMLGFESLDNTFRLILHQVVNGASTESQFAKPPQKALLPAEFRMELPVGSTKPWTAITAGTARA